MPALIIQVEDPAFTTYCIPVQPGINNMSGNVTSFNTIMNRLGLRKGLQEGDTFRVTVKKVRSASSKAKGQKGGAP